MTRDGRRLLIGRRAGLLLLGAGVLLAVLAVPGGTGAADESSSRPPVPPSPRPAEGDDPFPVRRVLLPPERLAAELQKVGQGVLRKVPLAEFEDRVWRARAAARGVPP